MKAYTISTRDDGAHVWYDETEAEKPISVIIDADLTIAEAQELLECLADAITAAGMNLVKP